MHSFNRTKSEAEKNEERLLNYERYRTLIINDSLGSKFIIISF
jgi:hypothetical protein